MQVSLLGRVKATAFLKENPYVLDNFALDDEVL